MADAFGVSEERTEDAMTKINKKIDELNDQAVNISTAFTTLTETVQLTWLNELIRNEWNDTGSKIVENAEATMKDLVSSLEKINQTGEEMSNV